MSIESITPANPAQVTDADLDYGLKLIAEAIDAHFGDRDDAYKYEMGDTTIHDVWGAYDALAASLSRMLVIDKLADHTNLELSWGAHPDDDTEACWQVHRVNGGRNDREWTLVGVGKTPQEALYAALPSAMSEGEIG